MKMGAEPQREHERRRVEEEDLPLAGRKNVAGDVLNPAIGPSSTAADHGVGDEQNEKQPCADEKLVISATAMSSAPEMPYAM